MIVKMRKMDLLLYHREQGKFLEELRNLGVVHITSEEQTDSAAAQELRGEAQRAHRIAVALKKLQKGSAAAASAATGNAAELIARFEECEARRDRTDQEIVSLTKDRAALEPWGDFDPQSVKRLAEVGVGMKFYAAQSKKYEAIAKDKAKLGIEVISEQDGFVRFVTVFRGEAPEVHGIEEVRLPDTSIRALNAGIEEAKRERAAVAAEIEKMAPAAPAIEQYRNERLNGLKYEEARLSMAGAAEGKLFKMSGWLTRQDQTKVESFLNKYPAYVAFRDPAADEDVPVKLKNDKFNKLFEPIIDMYSLPNYREIDVVPFIAPFFTIFYGLCLADAGYGLLIVIASIVAMFKVSARARPLMMLGFILGAITIVSGVLQNSCFGTSLYATGDGGFALLPFNGEGLAVLSENAGGTKGYPTMSLSFVAAFLQLFLGMGIQAYMQMRDNGFKAGLQPISSIFMASGLLILGAKTNFLSLGINTFAVGAWKIGPTLVNIGNYQLGSLTFGIGEILLFGGVAMLLFFNNLDKIIFLRPLTGLWALYNYASGLLSNVLSYMRLFALGLAGGLLGGAVNNIAFMLAKNKDGQIHAGIVATVIILIVGHLGNLGLSGLGSFIHTLRLTFVEFYGAMGFNGGGKRFTPFAKVEQ